MNKVHIGMIFILLSLVVSGCQAEAGVSNTVHEATFQVEKPTLTEIINTATPNSTPTITSTLTPVPTSTPSPTNTPTASRTSTITLTPQIYESVGTIFQKGRGCISSPPHPNIDVDFPPSIPYVAAPMSGRLVNFKINAQNCNCDIIFLEPDYLPIGLDDAILQAYEVSINSSQIKQVDLTWGFGHVSPLVSEGTHVVRGDIIGRYDGSTDRPKIGFSLTISVWNKSNERILWETLDPTILIFHPENDLGYSDVYCLP